MIQCSTTGLSTGVVCRAVGSCDPGSGGTSGAEVPPDPGSGRISGAVVQAEMAVVFKSRFPVTFPWFLLLHLDLCTCALWCLLLRTKSNRNISSRLV